MLRIAGISYDLIRNVDLIVSASECSQLVFFFVLLLRVVHCFGF